MSKPLITVITAIVLAFKRVLAHIGLILLCDKSKEESEFFTLRVELRK